MKRFCLLLALFCSVASAAEIKLAPGTWTGTGRVIIVVDAAGNQTVTLDPTAPVTITGGGGVIPTPPPVVVPPQGTLAATVKSATAGVPDYPSKEQHRRSMAFGMTFLAQATANVPVAQARATVRQFCDAACDASAVNWIRWWQTVDAKLDSMQLTPATYTAALGEMAQALTADLPAASTKDEHGQQTYGIDKELLLELFKLLLPYLLKLLGLT